MPNLMRQAHRFARLPATEKLHFFAAWLLLGVARLAIVTVSFKRLAPHLGVDCGAHPCVPLLTAEAERQAQRVGRAIRRAACRTPWESNCFPQAVAARLLLGWHGIPFALCFGLTRDSADRELKAHAWIAAGRVAVTGGAGFGRYAVVGCFVAPAIATPPPYSGYHMKG